jgi:uncharacterized protein (DUF1015 family)
MATIIPFKAIRPSKDKVHLVASRSVDGYYPSELKDKLAGNPFTFLHVINPDFADGKRTRPGSKDRLEKVKRRFKGFIKDGIFLHEERPAYYIYSQLKNGTTSTGIIACAGIDDYLNGAIRVHEQTITQREEKLKEYLDVCEFNAEPVLFCYPNEQRLDELISRVTRSEPEYDFTTTDKVRHTLWVVKDESTTKAMADGFSKVPHIYIADGHHRSASSALLGLARRKANPGYSGDEPFNYFLGVFFAEKELKIYDYNRLVKDMNYLSVEDFLKKLDGKFSVREVRGEMFRPGKKHEISMYAAGKWYALEAKEGTYNSKDPVGSLDASILTQHILSPLFGIHDLKIDKRIGFIPGVKGPEALKRSVDEGKAEVAFGLYPVTMEHLKWIADSQSIMPPKSTWIEPKMRSGLVIYSFGNGL